ncbi:hypothetical protein [Propionibacterium ruminifibrarum]|nr:hypothetical protein [Propionibacterium ruminifibrarum]
MTSRWTLSTFFLAETQAPMKQRIAERVSVRPSPDGTSTLTTTS